MDPLAMRVMESITLVVTLVMFLTGIPPCVNMYKTGSTKNVPFIIFLLSATSCFGMFHYSVMIGNGTMLFLNALGFFLQTTYVLLYVWLTRSKVKPLMGLLLALSYICGLYTYLYRVVVHPDRIADTLGMMSSLITTVIVCFPALEIMGNIRNENADGMPRVMLLGGLACSSSWLVYGMMLDDPNVYAPNIPGLVITVVKLYVIQLYAQSPKVKQS